MQAKHVVDFVVDFGRKAAVVSALVLGLTAAPAWAEVATETATLGDFAITLHIQPFLSEEDLGILRMIATSTDALALFVPDAQGFSAMAASPDEGFVKDGVPAASVMALGGLVDAQTAARDAIAGCQAAAQTPTPCALLLEIAPQ